MEQSLKSKVFLTSLKSLFVFNLIISGNYIGDLFGCRIQDLFDKNIYIKHLLGFLTLYFFVSLVDDELKYNAIYKLLMTSAIYLVFLFSTKMYYKSWLGFISLLGLVYIISIIKEIFKNDDKLLNILSYIQYGLGVVAIVLLILGMLYYMGEKKIEYKDKFSYQKFFFAAPACRGETPSIDKSIPEIITIGLSPISDV